MPALRNIRQERFAHYVVQGIPVYHAYEKAGYRPHKWSPYRLRDTAVVKHRINELQRRMMQKTKDTVHTIAEELNEAREVAARVGQPSAMVAASMGKAKLLGLIIDKSENINHNIENATEADLRSMVEELGVDFEVFCKAIGLNGIEGEFPFQMPESMQKTWSEAADRLIGRATDEPEPEPTHEAPDRKQ